MSQVRASTLRRQRRQQPPAPHRSETAVNHPLRWGFVATLGVLAAIVAGLAVYNLRGIVFSIFMAMFIAVGLDPLVRSFEKRGMKRGWSILTVMLLIVAFLVTIVWVLLPVLFEQVQTLLNSIPELIDRLVTEGWFDETNEISNGVIGTALNWVKDTITDPVFLASIGGGVVGLGFSIAGAISSGFFIAALTIYFVGTYDSTKRAAVRLVSAYHRESFAGYMDRILGNVGKYLSGMVVLAFMNATFSTILLILVGIEGAIFIGVIAFFITLIPLIGTVLTTFAMSFIALLYSPQAGLIVFVFMFIYMQVEAYFFSPRIMKTAVSVPGSVVLISAMAGGTLFGLPGALVAIPISAGIVLIVTEVVMPAKDRATT